MNNWHQNLTAFLHEKAKNPKAVKHLDLSKRKIKWGIWNHPDDELFRPFCNLESIDLSDNNIDIVVIDFSRYEKLRSINLSRNDLKYWGDTDQFRIGEQANNKYLEHLDLSYGNLGYVTINKKAPFLQSLKSLDLSGSSFTDFSLKGDVRPILKLEALPNLETLGLRDNLYQGVPKLRYLPSIQNLDLSLNTIRCNYQELLYLPRLKNLKLVEVKLRQIPKIFERFKQLEILDLRLNELDSWEVKKLQEKLPNTTILVDDFWTVPK